MKGSKTRQAMDYILNQWPELIGYCQRGDLHISNVMAENAIRPFAVGRKAWLFADTRRGAEASATWYSIIETAKANNLEPLSLYPPRAGSHHRNGRHACKNRRVTSLERSRQLSITHDCRARRQLG